MAYEKLSTFSLTLFLISNMIGSSIFIIPSKILEASNSYIFATLSWLISLFITCMVGVCYAELGSIFPNGTGDTTYLSEGYSKKVGLAFSIVSMTIILPAMCSIMLNLMSTTLETNKYATNMLITALVLLLNVYSLDLSIFLQNIFTVLRVILLCIFILIALLASTGVVGSTAGTYDLNFSFKFEPFLVSIIFMQGSFEGFNSGNFITDRISNPRHSLIRAIIYSLVTVCCIYMLICYSMFVVIPADKLMASKNITATYFEHLDVKILKNYFPKILVIFPSLGSLNGCVILLKALAKNHFRCANVILFLLSVLTYIFSFFEMTSILKKVGCFIYVFYLLSILSLFKFRRKRMTALNISPVIIGSASFICFLITCMSCYCGFVTL